MKTIKFSGQRNAIKEFLMHTDTHPTADDIYIKIRESYPNISLGTVYRNLNFLLEQGEIIKIACDDKSVRYDGRLKPHYHAYCRICGRVTDILTDPMDHVNSLAAVHFNGIIEGHVLLFHGICQNCLHNSNNSNAH